MSQTLEPGLIDASPCRLPGFLGLLTRTASSEKLSADATFVGAAVAVGDATATLVAVAVGSGTGVDVAVAVGAGGSGGWPTSVGMTPGGGGGVAGDAKIRPPPRSATEASRPPSRRTAKRTAADLEVQGNRGVGGRRGQLLLSGVRSFRPRTKL